jgi:hypothetical protein
VEIPVSAPEVAQRSRPFFDWTPDDRPGYFLPYSRADELHTAYSSPVPNRPLQRVIEVAGANSARSIFVELRYIDADFRSEHARFYGTMLRRYPTVCHRLHFFAEEMKDWRQIEHVDDDAYLGYSVIRPLPHTPVGRTMIRPPPRLRDAVLCVAESRAHLFGRELKVEAMPFMSQDGVYLRCAHACMWMQLHHAYLSRSDVPRLLPADVRDAALGGEVGGRQLPHDGLSESQVLDALTKLGFTAAPMRPDWTRRPGDANDLRTPGVLARYINSQMPPMVHTADHAWLAVGYYYDGEPGDGTARFVFHDDTLGPYLDPLEQPGLEHLDIGLQRRLASEDAAVPDRVKPWLRVVAPLPSKLYLTAPKAERLGIERMEYVAREKLARDRPFVDRFVETDALRRAGNTDDPQPVGYRTYAVLSNRFKAGLRGRVPDDLADVYMQLGLSRYIWVVEALDMARATNPSAPCVIGEAIIDGTALDLEPDNRPALLARNVAGNVKFTTLDHRETRVRDVRNFEPYQSGCTNVALPRLVPAADAHV